MGLGRFFTDLLVGDDAPAKRSKRWWVNNPRYGHANNEENWLPGWRGYVNYAVDHALAGGTFDSRMLDRNKHGVNNYEGSANIRPLLKPGQLNALPVSATMLVEICRELRKRGKRFPVDKIVHSTHVNHNTTQTLPGEKVYMSGNGLDEESGYQPITREQLVERGSSSLDYGVINIQPWDYRPLDEAVGMVEAHLDDVSAGTEQNPKEDRFGGWFSGQKMWAASANDYLDFLANHLEAGGRITSILDKSVPEMKMDGYRVEHDYKVGPDRKRDYKRMGVKESEFGAIWMVASEDFDLPPAAGAVRLRGIICKPGVKRLGLADPKERLYQPGVTKHVMMPVDLAEDLGKLLKRRGIKIKADQVPAMNADEQQRVWGKHAPEIARDTPAPAAPHM